MEKLKQLTLNNDIDILALSEVNKDWRTIDYDNSIWGATSSWTEHRRVQVSYNTSATAIKEYQPGGTAMVMFGELTFRISFQSCDPRGLGRWSTLTLTGKQDVHTTIITCYCPTRSKSLGSTFVQQLIYMANNKDILPEVDCPRQLFGIDIREEIETFANKGHNIIVMGDFNSNYQDLSSWMVDVGLTDLINHRHGKCPITHTRSLDKPLDVIFGSPNFKIAKGGFLPFQKLLSDHRGIWIDIPKIFIFGYKPQHPVFPAARRLKLKDPRVVKKYLSLLHSSMIDNDLFHRMDDLHHKSKSNFSQQSMEEYESIDELVCNLMDEAERNCRKIHAGAITWSPAYKEAGLLLEYWLKRRSYELHKHTNVRELINLQNKLKLNYDPSLTIPVINLRIKAAYNKRKLCKKNAESLSLEYRTQLALAKEAAGEGDAAGYLRTLNALENTRRLYRNIRRMEQKCKGGCTSKVTTTINGIEQEHTDRHKIDKVCADENQRKYHLPETGTSQLLEEAFIRDLGHHGEGPEINKVLNGTYIPPTGASQPTKDYLEACATTPAILTLANQPTIPYRYKTHTESWKCRKEKTTTYNQSMAHYKAIFSDKFISWFFFQRADIPETTGYSPQRHRRCVDLMIMKKHMNFDIKKQRTLGILDTEFNQNNKRIGNEGMRNATKLNKVAKEQFAIKNSASTEQIVSKRAVLDHSQFMRKIILLASTDLEACYDRIIHTAAALALLRVGIPHAKINSMFESIQKMTHKIRTLYGDSEITWGGEVLDNLDDWKNYPQGVLQGNACGPTIWSLVSSIIFEILHKRGFAVEFCTTISKETFKLVGFAYVDDSDLLQTGSDPREVLTSMQNLINMWGNLIDVTGGALSVEKSWWYMIDYVWKHGRWVATDSGENLDLLATTTTGTRISLKRLHANEASKMLGIYVAPDGNNTAQITELKKASNDWGSKMRQGHSTRKEAWTALSTNITAKLKYPLPACSLTEKDCKAIMWPALKAALPKSGISSYISSGHRDGPREYGGAGCLSLFHYQGTARTALIVEAVNRETPTGFLLHLCIEDVVLDVGQYGSLWDMQFKRISQYIQTHSLIFHMWKYNTDHDINISLEHIQLSEQREGDTAIMGLAQRILHSRAEHRSIQTVRMKLGVIHLSDITTADGYKLDQRFYSTTPPCIQRNEYDWPIKHRVTPLDISTWRRFLRLVFTRPQLSLERPLGPWISMKTTSWISNWDYFLSQDKQFLYHRVKSRWHRHLKRQFTHRLYNTEYLELETLPTNNVLRTTIKHTNASLTSTSCSQKPDLPMPSNIITLSFGQISLRKPRIDWFMKFISSSSTTTNLWRDILEGQAYAVSDGSYFPSAQTGACAWIVATRDGTEWVKGGGIIPGVEEDQDSYRSELGGQVGLAAFITSIILPLDAAPNITLACDGLAAINRVNMDSKIIKAKMKNADMLTIISALWKDSEFTITKQHVYGHQDDLGRKLTQLEQLNCRVDIWAKEIAQKQISGAIPKAEFTATTCGFGTITCKDVLITSNLQSNLYKHVTKHNFISTLSTNPEVPKDFSSLRINWGTFSKARMESSLNMQTFVTKWLSGDTSTGRVMKARKARLLDTCPQCNQEDEHLLHVLTCRSEGTRELRDNLILELILWLDSVYTSSTITNFVKVGLTKWFSDQDHTWDAGSHIFSNKTTEDNALKSQLQVGWYYLLCGMITTDIIHLQQVHYTEIESSKMGTRWAINFTQKLWQMIHTLWKHRCNILFKNNRVDSLSGLTQLRTTITKEYGLGQANLPHVYSSFFHIPLDSLLKKQVHHLKRWFLIVRSAREAHTLIRDIDDFSFDEPLRSWIGLIDNG